MYTFCYKHLHQQYSINNRVLKNEFNSQYRNIPDYIIIDDEFYDNNKLYEWIDGLFWENEDEYLLADNIIKFIKNNGNFEIINNILDKHNYTICKK